MSNGLPEWTPKGRAQVVAMERQLERIRNEQQTHVTLAEQALEAAVQKQQEWIAWAEEQVRLAKHYEDLEIQEAKKL